MIYSKPIDAITWDDVAQFCEQQLAENQFLDYKADFPNNLEKTIAAMANTLGGIILIGVAEDKLTSRPTLPLTGVDLTRGLPERVLNIALSNIWPPLVPEATVVEHDGRAVVVVRIEQSEAGPHAVAGRKEIYIRTGSVTPSESLATVAEIEWLQARRTKAKELRDELIHRLEVRANIVSAGRLNSPGVMRLIGAPRYPTGEFVSPPSLKRKIGDIAAFSTEMGWFPQDMSSCTLTQDGVTFSAMDNKQLVTQVTSISAMCAIGHHEKVETAADTQTVVVADWILSRSAQFLYSLFRLSQLTRYSGVLGVSFRLAASDKFSLFPVGRNFTQGFGKCLDQMVQLDDSFPPHEAPVAIPRIVTAWMQRVYWSFGLDLSPTALKGTFELVAGALANGRRS